MSHNRASVAFFVNGIPQPKGSAKAFKHRTTGKVIVQADNRGTLKAWERAVAIQARAVRPRTEWLGPVSLDVVFYMPKGKSVKRVSHTVRPDLSKLLRGIEDALTGIVYRDDAQIVGVSAKKEYSESGVVGAGITVDTW